jgi:hypothetical protein
MKRSFPLYDEKDLFVCSSKKIYKELTNLIEHKHDDDCDTDEEIVDDHVDLCLDELKLRINEFLNGNPLELIRNIREEFSGLQRIECNEEEDANSSP